MKKALKVKEFSHKQQLLDFVNANTDSIEIVSISSSQEAFFFRHFLWYYEG
ncbi:hypothetical protein [Robertkochia sediminum]|uniref:hypothetical protein n=1 Tax=Robertkochia sediminum TaxID=2785326 RepID=UPI0019312F15|nr:hypothetical protein [Robertkochia sediminum]MBL7472919.1 hypothetical protein [Robertkochia sediminum]